MTKPRPEPSAPLPEHALRKLLALAAEGEVEGGNADAELRGQQDWLARLPARYTVRRELGRGGMGVVYEAHDRQLDRLCAVKVIGATVGADTAVRRRFEREALAAARLRHPHIAAIYDATPDYISMQRIVGVPLDSIERGERRLIVELVRDAARAVHHAHEQGVVHRDLKPSNLLVEGRHVYVVDFGLAKHISLDASLSMSGTVLGTPAFMPPEQALGRGEAVDARSDVYALGATLYHCLTGAPPFAADDLPELLRCVVEEDPPAPRIDRDLDLVMQKCLAKEPERRYATARDLADDLDRWLRSEPVLARRPSLAYRLRKHLQRRGALLRAAGIAALAAVGMTAMVLVPIALRESAGRVAASEAVALSEQTAAVLQDALVYSRLGDLPSAYEALDEGIASAREFLTRHDVPRVHHLLSRLLRARGQPVEALGELEAAIAGDPGLEEARFERGIMLASQTDLTEAERRQAVADLSTEVGPRSVLTSVDLLFGRAEKLRLTGDLERGKEMLLEVLAYDPAHVPARVSLSQIALQQGDGPLALHYSASAVDLQQGHGPIYFAQEQRRLPTTMFGLDAALVDFAPELLDSPDNALAMGYRGLVQLRRALRLEADGDAAGALRACEAAVEDHDVTLSIHDRLAGAFNNRAVCLMETQRLRAAAGDSAGAGAAGVAAARDLERARSLDPRLAEAHYNAGLLALRNAKTLRMLGRAGVAARESERARAALQSALDVAGPDWHHASACRQRLAEAG